MSGLTLLWATSSHAVGELGENGGANSNPHNLSSLSGNSKKALTETQICVFCHIPHGAMPQTTLWSRKDPDLMGSFPTFTEPASVQDPSGILGINDIGIVNTTLYGNNTYPNEYPNGASKLCLSCHDGVTAMGILANNDEFDIVGNATAMAVDLSVSHPISFVYNLDVKNYLNALPKIDKYTFPTSAYLDGNSRIQCTVCHEPHTDTKEGTYPLPFWRNAGKNANAEADYDAICAACHSTLYDTTTFPDHNYP